MSVHARRQGAHRDPDLSVVQTPDMRSHRGITISPPVPCPHPAGSWRELLRRLLEGHGRLATGMVWDAQKGGSANLTSCTTNGNVSASKRRYVTTGRLATT
jgi:hypothetical protein